MIICRATFSIHETTIHETTIHETTIHETTNMRLNEVVFVGDGV
jgi:hypothetical protein